MKLLLKIFFSLIILSCQSPSIGKENATNDPKFLNGPYVLLISIDGYRYDYTKLYNPPNIQKLMQGGSYSKGLIPVYPTKTFPNHYSIATGLYADKHGIVSNSFFDPNLGERYKIGSATTTDGKWYGGTPLWVAAEKAGMLSASFFWVGSDANIQNTYPTYYYKYDGSISNSKRVSQVVDWLKLPSEKRPHMITLYFSDVDSAGHRFGPTSIEVKEAVHKIDQQLGVLITEVNKLNLPVNIILVSDHGMQEIDPKLNIYLEDYIDLSSDIRIDGKGSHALMYIKDKKLLKETYKKLRRVDGIKVYKKSNTPRRYHYRNNDRIGDLVISVLPPRYLRLSRSSRSSRSGGGTHGYEVRYSPDMKGIFYAKGPNIKPLGQIKEFSNVHIYPMIMKILGLEIKNPIDGKIRVLKKIIRNN